MWIHKANIPFFNCENKFFETYRTVFKTQKLRHRNSTRLSFYQKIHYTVVYAKIWKTAAHPTDWHYFLSSCNSQALFVWCGFYKNWWCNMDFWCGLFKRSRRKDKRDTRKEKHCHLAFSSRPHIEFAASFIQQPLCEQAHEKAHTKRNSDRQRLNF